MDVLQIVFLQNEFFIADDTKQPIEVEYTIKKDLPRQMKDDGKDQNIHFS